MLAAASLALNQRGEGSSPSGPTDRSGCRKAWFNPPASEAGDRWFKSSHPDSRFRARGRAAQAPAFHAGQAGSTPAGHSGRLFDNVADDDGPVGNRQTTLPQNERCCGFNSHLGH